MQFYGYYFYETVNNTYRIALVCEYIDQKFNMEILFRKRKQQNKEWKPFELESIAASLISTFSYLESIGVCHRDVKPANLFLLPNYLVKVIDFGESKDYVIEKSNDNDPNMATIRGTPQYLSPILWKAHVIDGNSRQAKHNMYKSDVFSTGLVLIQLAILDDVTGFNQKSRGTDGEKLIENTIMKLSKNHSKTFCELLRQMLLFKEVDRPNFIQLAENFLNKPFVDAVKLKRLEDDPEPTKEFSQINDQDADSLKLDEEAKNEGKKEKLVLGSLQDKSPEKTKKPTLDEESTERLLSQNELFKEYSQSNDLHVNVTDMIYWFEYGGNSISEYNVNKAETRWKIIGKYKNVFSTHFVMIFAESQGYYLLGPNALGTCLQYKSRRLIPKQNMPERKSFFCGIFIKTKIYTFGGYDSLEKLQLKSCEIYDIENDSWIKNPASLNKARSQAAVCIMTINTIYIFGGYNKQDGTLGSIEKYSIKENIIKLLKLTMPNPLRRFSAIKIAPTKILLLGGLQKLGKESDSVYCVDFEDQETVEKLDKLSKGGVIEAPIIIDPVGCLHLFIENCSGTAPPYHITYTFLEYS